MLDMYTKNIIIQYKFSGFTLASVPSSVV